MVRVRQGLPGGYLRLRRKFWAIGFAMADLLEYTSRPFFGPAKCGVPLLVIPMMKTTVFAKSGSVRGDWFVVDASDKTLGRLATQIAHRLKGKHKAIYSPHVDMGDHIVVLNAEKIHVTGRKLSDKIYYHHTGYIGGIKSIALEKLLKEHPERVIEIAVKGMLPKNTLGRQMFRKLHVFAGAEHPHTAQQPKPLEIQ
jgi:large subunit ribosomal protein L13